MANNAQARSDDRFNSLDRVGPDIECLLDMLKAELDPIHGNDVALHQLWLETQWLQSNMRSDVLCLPRNWQLIVFQLIKGDTVLSNYPTALRMARMLAQALRNSVPSC